MAEKRRQNRKKSTRKNKLKNRKRNRNTRRKNSRNNSRMKNMRNAGGGGATRRTERRAAEANTAEERSHKGATAGAKEFNFGPDHELKSQSLPTPELTPVAPT